MTSHLIAAIVSSVFGLIQIFCFAHLATTRFQRNVLYGAGIVCTIGLIFCIVHDTMT